MYRNVGRFAGFCGFLAGFCAMDDDKYVRVFLV